MTRPTSVTGADAIALVVLSGFGISLWTLYALSSGGAISFATKKQVLVELLGVFTPMVALVAGIYPYSNRAAHRVESWQTVVWVVFVTAVWAAAPSAFLAIEDTVEDAVALLSQFRVFAESAAIAVVASYYARSGTQMETADC